MENRNIWVDYLRSAITVLVVAHHATLAYTTFAYFDKNAYINSTHPIVDAKRWIGLNTFVSFNDIFFMSLMFLIGGLFLSKSLSKKGSLNFIIDRFYRLFLPFIFLGTLFMLVAYFPSFYVAKGSASIYAYIKDFFTVEKWPVGPPWFIWLLFIFNLLYVLIYPLFEVLRPNTAKLFSAFQHKPVQLFFCFHVITWLLYVPIAYNIGAGTWTGWGPFDFQLSRILLYFGYFIIGSMIGNTDFNNELFSLNSMVVKNWWFWVLLALICFIILTIMSDLLTQLVKNNQLKAFNSWMIYYGLYVTSCTLNCLAFLTTFRRFINSQKAWWTSLSDNAYLIYLLHYIFVTWIQFLLMAYEIPAILKFLITFMFALVFSWGISILLRKSQLIRKYL
jgi:glucans biosynthesis protein C